MGRSERKTEELMLPRINIDAIYSCTINDHAKVPVDLGECFKRVF